MAEPSRCRCGVQARPSEALNCNIELAISILQNYEMKDSETDVQKCGYQKVERVKINLIYAQSSLYIKSDISC